MSKDDYKHSFMTAQELIDDVKPVVNFSFNLDMILGGGIPLGSFVVVAGQKKLGKTTSILHFAANAQAKGCKVYYLDVECRIKPRDLKGIPNLDRSKDKFEIIRSNKKKILFAEDFLSITMNKLETEENCIIILDSVSQLCSNARQEGDIGDRFRDDVPLMLSTLTKRAANVLPVNNNILICITHMIANQGGKGPALWLEASGQKIQYQADVKLKATYAEDHKDAEDKQVGQLIHWECDTAALGPPGGKTTTLLRYGEGLDDCYDLLSTCLDIGLVTKSGAWIKFHDNTQAQGKEKATQHLKNSPKLYKELQTKFKELIA